MRWLLLVPTIRAGTLIQDFVGRRAMYETDVEQYAVPTPRAKRLRLAKLGVKVGIFTSLAVIVWAFVTKVQDAADRIS
jgi:hypothetical protein